MLTTNARRQQDSQVTKAQARAREILKYSPIVTDAYFHYTPSQIMLAALSIADHSLFERLMDATFPRHLPDSGTSTPGANGRQADPRKSALVMGQAIKKKTVDMVQACQEMLLQEPPERLANFWGTVSRAPPPPQLLLFLSSFLSSNPQVLA